MILYDYWRSSAAYRVRIALHAKDLAFDQRPVNLAQGEQHGAAYKTLNPQGLVPLLVDGDVRVSQSLAIIEYLEEAYADAPTLLPAGASERAQTRAMAQLLASDVHPLNNLRVLKMIEGEYGADEVQKKAWIAQWIHRGFEALEQWVSGDGFCMGEILSVADCCFIPQCYSARRFDVPLEAYPKLCAIEQRLLLHPAVKAAQPEMQQDAVK